MTNKPLYVENMKVELYSPDEYRLDVNVGAESIVLNKEQAKLLLVYIKQSLEDV